MLFNSLPFALLFIVTLIVFYIPILSNYQVCILVLSSFIFYAYDQPYLLTLLLLSAIISTICSYNIIRVQERRRKIVWAGGGVIVNLLILAFFKYGPLATPLFSGSLALENGMLRKVLSLPLPIGISFYTFHGISLLIDVLRNGQVQTACAWKDNLGIKTHLLHTLLYLTFFPQLIAGPITKANFFYPQIVRKLFSDIQWETAAKNLITGFFLKMVVADNLSELTFWISYPHFLNISGLELLAYLFGYSIQIFADFAGYSLIAIGLAALFGYTLPQNFNYPYISQSFSEFWRRWHMSLSSWLRDYLYYPLGGNRKGSVRTYVNLFLVMFLGGLWHGAAWSYAVWGTWHGVALAIERFFRDSKFYTSDNIACRFLRTIIVFTFVTLAWLLFKLPNLSHVIEYIMSIFINYRKFPNPSKCVALIVYTLPVVAYHFAYVYDVFGSKLNRFVRHAAYATMLLLVLLNSGDTNAFIYFQF